VKIWSQLLLSRMQRVPLCDGGGDGGAGGVVIEVSTGVAGAVPAACP
jgi:hypothetical protein